MSNNQPDYEDNLYFEKKKDIENLTERWKNGKLTEGWYYVLYKNGARKPAEYIKWHYRDGGERLAFERDDVIEVLAKVPSYEDILRKGD